MGGAPTCFLRSGTRKTLVWGSKNLRGWWGGPERPAPPPPPGWRWPSRGWLRGWSLPWGTPAGPAWQANGVMPLPVDCLLGSWLTFLFLGGGKEPYSFCGFSRPDCTRPSSVETPDNGSLLKWERVLGIYKSGRRSPLQGLRNPKIWRTGAESVGLPLCLTASAEAGADSCKVFRNPVGSCL